MEYPVSDDLVTSTGFADYTVEAFQSMSSPDTFLNEVLKGFVMPER